MNEISRILFVLADEHDEKWLFLYMSSMAIWKSENSLYLSRRLAMDWGKEWGKINCKSTFTLGQSFTPYGEKILRADAKFLKVNSVPHSLNHCLLIWACVGSIDCIVVPSFSFQCSITSAKCLYHTKSKHFAYDLVLQEPYDASKSHCFLFGGASRVLGEDAVDEEIYVYGERYGARNCARICLEQGPAFSGPIEHQPRVISSRNLS